MQIEMKNVGSYPVNKENEENKDNILNHECGAEYV